MAFDAEGFLKDAEKIKNGISPEQDIESSKTVAENATTDTDKKGFFDRPFYETIPEMFNPSAEERQKMYDDALAETQQIDINPDENEENPGVDADLAAKNEQARANFVQYVEDKAADANSMDVFRDLHAASIFHNYIMTPEEKFNKAREIARETGLTTDAILEDDTTYKNAMALYDYTKKSQAAMGEGQRLDYKKVLQQFPELQNIADMDDEQMVMALHDMSNIRELHNLFDDNKSLWHQYKDYADAVLKRGEYEYGQRREWYKVAEMKDAAAAFDKGEALSAEAQKNPALIAPNIFYDPLKAVIYGVGTSMPQQLHDMLEGGGIGAVLGGVAGLTIGAATVAVAGAAGVPISIGAGAFVGAATLMGAREGFWAGNFNAMAKDMEGEHYQQLFENRNANGRDAIHNHSFTHTEMQKNARLTGPANAFWEVADQRMFMGLVTPGKKQAEKGLLESLEKLNKKIAREQAIDKAASEAGKEAGKQAAKDTIVKESVLDFAKEELPTIAKVPIASSVGEGMDEALQSATSDLMENKLKAETGRGGRLMTADEILTKAGNSFIGAMPGGFGFGFMGVPMHAFSATTGLTLNIQRRVEDQQRYTEEARHTLFGVNWLAGVQRIVGESKLNNENDAQAQELQRKIIREQAEGSGFEMVYIDTASVLENENGQEQLEKIAKAAGMDEDAIQAAVQNGNLSVPIESFAQAQADNSVLTSISFSEHEDSIAEINKNAKEIAQRQQEYLKEAAEEFERTKGMIIQEYFPNDKEAAEQAVIAIYNNPQNPSAGIRAMEKELQNARQEIIAPALARLKEGMGNGVEVITDENGQGVRVSNNEPWYQKFYAAYGRAPRKDELEKMAAAMLTGEAGAPEVEGWRITDKAEYDSAEDARQKLRDIDKNLEVIGRVKEKIADVTASEMQNIIGLTPEAFSVYRTIADQLKTAPGTAARAARLNAIIFARHADRFAKIMTEKSGMKFTALDYYNRVNVEFGGEQAGGFAQMAGVKAANAPLGKLEQAKAMLQNGKDANEIWRATGWMRGKDKKWRFEIADNLDAINLQPLLDGKWHYLGDIYQNDKLYEAYPRLADISIIATDEVLTADGFYNGEYIGINLSRLKENIDGDEHKKTLVHEIQHVIQGYEDFATGGSPRSVMMQIVNQQKSLEEKITKGLSKDTAYNLMDLLGKYHDALSDSNGAIIDGDVESAKQFADSAEKIKAEIQELHPEKNIEKILELYNDWSNLNQIQRNNDSIENLGETQRKLYRLLAGEQEARQAELRADVNTENIRAALKQGKIAGEIGLQYEKLYNTAPQELKELADEYAGILESNTTETADIEANIARMNEIEASASDLEHGQELIQLLSDYAWEHAGETEAWKDATDFSDILPRPHNFDAIIVFNGQEFGAASIIGETGAANLDKAQEINTRLDNLAAARQMEEAKKDAKTIKLATGWERGADGKWRYEIPDGKVFREYKLKLSTLNKKLKENQRKIDSLNKEIYDIAKNQDENSSDYIAASKKLQAAYNEKTVIEGAIALNTAIEAAQKGETFIASTDIASLLNDDTLIDAYPSLSRIKVKFESDATTRYVGYTTLENGKMVIGINVAKAKDINDIIATLHHEIQHAIQDKEGFARGSSVEEFATGEEAADAKFAIEEAEYNLSRVTESIAKGLLNGARMENESLLPAIAKRLAESDATLEEIVNEFSLPEKAIWDMPQALYNRILPKRKAALDRIKERYNPVNRYHRTAGEVEARNVQARMDMSWADRQKTLLAETEDVAREDQIFLRNGETDSSFARQLNEWLEGQNGQKDTNKTNKEGKTDVSVFTKDVTRPTGKEAKKAAEQAFRERYPKGKEVHTKIGNVSVSSSGIHNSLAHGYNSKKLSVVPFIPEALEQSKFMESIPDYDNKKITNHFFVGEVTVDGENNYVLLRVREQGNDRGFYIHEVATEAEINEKSNSLQTQAATVNGEKTLRGIALYTSILQKYIAEVKKNEKYHQETKGSTSPMSDGSRLIQLFETADESTFLHEMGHLFLLDLEDLARIDEVSAKELQTVREWAEWKKGDYKKYKNTPFFKDFADREQAIIDAEANGDIVEADRLKRVWMHERFARAFELYLRDGKAPAKGLRAVFRSFAKFLRQVYSAFISDGSRASTEVERIMARMIATDKEIEAAAMDDAFKDIEKAGGEKLLNETERQTYERWLNEAKEEAREKLHKIVMKDLLERDKEIFEEHLKHIEEKKRRELQQEPVYLAREAIKALGGDKQGALVVGYASVEDFEKEDAAAPPLEEAVQQYIDEWRRDYDAEEISMKVTEEAVREAMESSAYHHKAKALEAAAMARKMDLKRKINDKAEKALRGVEDALEAMPEQYDLQNDRMEAPVRAVMAKINSLRFSTKWSAKDFAQIERMIKAASREELKQEILKFRKLMKEQKLNIAAVEEANKGRMKMYADMARQSVTQQPIFNATNANEHLRAQRKAEANVHAMAKAGKWDLAIQQQQAAAMAAAVAKEAAKAKETVDKMVAGINKQLKAKTVKLPAKERYWHRWLCYNLRIGVAAEPEKPVLKNGQDIGTLEQMLQGYQERLDVAKDYDVAGIVQLVEAHKDTGYRSMTIAEFRKVVDLIGIIYKCGKDEFSLKTIAGVTIDEAVQDIIDEASLADKMHVDRQKIQDNTGGLGWNDWAAKIPVVGETAAKLGQDYISIALKPEKIIELLGEKAHKYIYGTFEKAANDEAEMMAKAIMDIQGMLANYSHEDRKAWKDIKYEILLPAEGGGIEKVHCSKENIICMALNLGTAKNRQRLTGGLFGPAAGATEEAQKLAAEGQTMQLVNFCQQNLSKEDWRLVQNIWDYLHSYWADTCRVEEELNGQHLAAEEPQAFTVVTPDGEVIEMQGGYYPVDFNAAKNAKAAEQAKDDVAQQMGGGAKVFGAGRKFVKSRSDANIYRELNLQFDVIPTHLQQVIHNITHRLAARDVYRLLNNSKMTKYIEEHLGMPYIKLLTQWSQDVWTQLPEKDMAGNIVERGLAALRRNSTFAIMAYRVWPVIENTSNIGPVSDELGYANALSAVAEFYGHMTDFRKLLDKSVLMRNRIDSMDRDIRSQSGLFNADSKAQEMLREHAYDMMTYSDLMFSAPLWCRAYKDNYMEQYRKAYADNEANKKHLQEAQEKLDKLHGKLLDNKKDINDWYGEKRNRARAGQIGWQPGASRFAVMPRSEFDIQIAELENNRDVLGKAIWEAEVELGHAQELKIYEGMDLIKEAERRAIAQADKAVRNAFGSGRTMDQAAVSRTTSEYVKAVTTFYSFFNTQFNALYFKMLEGKYNAAEKVGSWEKMQAWAPFAKSVMNRIIIVSLIGSLLKMATKTDGDDDKDKYRKVKKDGKIVQEEIPWLERFLKVFAKNTLSTSVGSFYLVRDVANYFINLAFDGTVYGRGFGIASTPFRSLEEGAKTIDLICSKSKRDLEIQEKEQRDAEKLRKMNSRQRRKWEEEQKYKKPVRRITYSEIFRHGLNSMTGLTAASTGISSTIVDAVTGTMQYMLDTDNRYDATWRNVIWSAIFDKRPVEKEVPKKPEPPKKKKRK